jgi:hypothetical protein
MRFRAAQKQPRARNTHHKKARLHRCKRARLSESVDGKPVRGTEQPPIEPVRPFPLLYANS